MDQKARNCGFGFRCRQQSSNFYEGLEQQDILDLKNPTFVLLKLFRDNNQALTGISSYALKTVVMHMRKDNPDDQWEKETQAEYFIKVRRRCQKAR